MACCRSALCGDDHGKTSRDLRSGMKKALIHVLYYGYLWIMIIIYYGFWMIMIIIWLLRMIYDTAVQWDTHDNYMIPTGMLRGLLWSQDFSFSRLRCFNLYWLAAWVWKFRSIINTSHPSKMTTKVNSGLRWIRTSSPWYLGGERHLDLPALTKTFFQGTCRRSWSVQIEAHSAPSPCRL